MRFNMKQVHDVIAYWPQSSLNPQPRKCNLSWNTRRYRISTLVKFKPPSNEMQLIMKYTMTLHIGPSRVSASSQEIAVDHETLDDVPY